MDVEFKQAFGLKHYDKKVPNSKSKKLNKFRLYLSIVIIFEKNILTRTRFRTLVTLENKRPCFLREFKA